MARLQPEMHPLLTQPVVEALSSKNIHTVLSFVEAEVKQLALITTLSYKDVVDIRKHLINKHSAVIQNGLKYYEELLQKTALLSTGIKNVDTILQGGLVTGNLYEICGLPASGKTQFCLTVVKNVVQTLDQYVYYIDTKGDFSGRKIKAMLDAAQLLETQTARIMTHILLKQISTHYELINCLYGIKRELCRGLKLRIIIIDSLPPLFYQSVDVTRNYGQMNHLANIMHLLSKEYHLIFIVTNAVTTWYEGDFKVERAITEKLGLGKYWFNIPHTRLMIKHTDAALEYEIIILRSNKSCKGKSCTVKACDMGFV